MKNDIMITIITVCYNAKKCIKETIQSVTEQSYPNVEYIIIDGASCDGTSEIVQEEARSANIKYISEPDQGIYDAMNKGIDLATGDYIQFLNAGDILLSKDTVFEVVKEIEKTDGDIFFGSIHYKYADGNIEIRKYGHLCGSRLYYYTGDCINHQAMYASKECFKKDKFDLSYKICADREWMMRMTKAGKRFVNMPINVCCYSLDESSVSLRQKELYKTEAKRCIKEHFPCGYWIFVIFEMCRESVLLKRILHKIYEWIYIEK